MPERTVQLVLQYDGSGFAGWQRQPALRTVQGVVEAALERLFGEVTRIVGAGRTDAGVHARGQSAHVIVPERWSVASLRRALNALLPADVWLEGAREVAAGFHARYSAVARRYTYRVGTDDGAQSPFRSRYEWYVGRDIDLGVLDSTSSMILGTNHFYGFAVKGTAPARDDHRCDVFAAEWHRRPGGIEFAVEANRFLHHMVRFLVGTMMAAATGRRTVGSVAELLCAPDNSGASPPAPAHALFLDHVSYPAHLYP